MKKIFQLFLAISLVFAISACTSKKVEDQTEDATADMTSDEVADGDVSEEDFGGGDEGTDSVAESTEEGSGDVAESTEAPAVDEGAAVDESAMAESTDAETPAADTATSDTPSDSSDMEGLAASTEETPSDMPSDTSSDTGDLGSSETPSDTSSDSTLADTSAPLEEPAPVAQVPLRKIESTPWTQGNTLVNAVYLARKGDNFAAVSQKIYGSEDKVSELRKINPTIAKRSMKVGDKVYYNSPKRPTDNTQLLTFYEDNGLVPETYVSQPGDNIRTVSKNLLGDSNSWKEIWATNSEVESKGELTEGTRLRYWAGEVPAATPAPVVAEQTPPAEMPPQDQAAAGAVAGEVPPPPSDNTPPPPMPEDVAQQAQTPPPPPMEESLPPEPVIAEAPPAPVDAGMAAAPEGEANPLADLLGGEDQTTALMIGALFLIAAAALFIIIKKRKSKKNIDFQTATHTQIE